ncbi:hypothetical protein SPBR_03857 [Sporothrix brasiliensis 5110]|uniref:Uncharacterized protein n=1 Tax=Sporothrix brasiliensis 5110 TaxID=1398154 RepID=A0A0C2F7G4_9PEZI|nr:uncharacterized protein SPBR_03857 [Sporothrix brasiliensis 5110]KIH94909.1 hypothetical protein SPBR_03857 [Sporothrix brasiliensis 5110]
MDQEVIRRVQEAIAAKPSQPPRAILTPEQLRQQWARGNEAGDQRKRYSTAYQLAIVKSQRRWERFCSFMDIQDWRAHIGTSLGNTAAEKIDDRFFAYTNAAIDKYDHLRKHPADKKLLGPDGFLYLSHYRWVRDDKTTFKIGLDRLDDVTIRQL